MEAWHGRRFGLEGAIKIYAADDAFPIEDMGILESGNTNFRNP